MYFNEINILDYYSVEWKSACVGVYQLLGWKMHGETLKKKLHYFHIVDLPIRMYLYYIYLNIVFKYFV